jgi:hypothetical protein
MVKDNPELKSKINDWVAAQKTKRREEKARGLGGEKKDDVDVTALDDHTSSSSASSSSSSGMLSLVDNADGPAVAAVPSVLHRAPSSSDDIHESH